MDPMSGSLMLASATLVAVVVHFIKNYHWLLKVQGPKMASGLLKGSQKGMYCIWTWLQPVVVLTSPSQCQDLYQGQGVQHRPRALGLGDLFQRYLGSCMGCKNGQDWTRVRKAFRSALSTQSADSCSHLIQEALDKWEDQVVKKALQSGQPISVEDLVGRMPFEFLVKVFFGPAFAEKNANLLESLRIQNNNLMQDIFEKQHTAAPWYSLLPTKTNKDLKTFQTGVDQLMNNYESSDERQSGHGGVIDHVLALKDNLSPAELSQTVVEIVFANQDVINNSTAWLFANAAIHADIQHHLSTVGKQAMDELNEDVIPNKATLDRSFTDFLNFINESARLTPVALMSSQEILQDSLIIENTMLPAQTHVSLDIASINKHPDYWQDPDSFNPDRFNDTNEKRRWAFQRFGMGPRKCPGQFYANLGMANTLLRLITKYDIVPVQAGLKEVPVHPKSAGFQIPNLDVYVRNRGFYVTGKASELSKVAAYVGVSMIPTSPLLKPQGAHQLVHYLQTLPHPTKIVITDSLNRHNIMAFEKVKNESDAEVTAIRKGQAFIDSIQEAIDKLPEAKAKVSLVQWRPIYNQDKYKAMMEACYRHYATDEGLKAKVNSLAEMFLAYRQPKASSASKVKRLPHLINYILEELPILLTGLSLGQDHLPLLIYPCSDRHIAGLYKENSLYSLRLDIFNKKLCPQLMEDLLNASGGLSATVEEIALPICES